MNTPKTGYSSGIPYDSDVKDIALWHPVQLYKKRKRENIQLNKRPEMLHRFLFISQKHSTLFKKIIITVII